MKNLRKRVGRFLLMFAMLFAGILLPQNTKAVWAADGSMTVHFLDVGQGDGILLQHTDGTTFLIDGGSTSKNNIGEYCLIPYLKSQGIHCIDYMIMTHADKDHISGQLELMKHVADRQDIQIRKLLLPLPSQEMQSEEGYRQMITAAKQADIPIQTICAKSRIICCLSASKTFF